MKSNVKTNSKETAGMQEKNYSSGKRNQSANGGKRRNNRKRYSKQGKENSQSRVDPCNDPAWYAKTAQELNDAASIPFSWSTGTEITISGGIYESATYKANTLRAPGIMNYMLYPAVGKATSPTDPINVAAQSLYTYIRHQNSGSANYDAPDLMLYVIAIGEVYSYINWLTRIYGIAGLYAGHNRYLPDGLLYGNGVNADDVRQNIAQLRYGINLLINKAASFCIPTGLPYFNRKAFLYSNIYTEGTSWKDQLYQFVPAAFYKYSLDSDMAGQLTLASIPKEGTWTVAQMLQFGNDLMMPLIMSEDMNIMSGDILKAYGANSIVRFAPVPDNLQIAPVFSIEVLEQMKNSTPVTKDIDTSVHQDSTKGYLVSANSIAVTTDTILDPVGAGFLASDRLITTTSADVTPALIMENTRLTQIANWTLSTDATSATVTFAPMTEVCVRVAIIYYKTDGTLNDFGNQYYALETTDQAALPNVSWFMMSRAFRFRPMNVVYVWDATTKTITYVGYDTSFDNYGVLHKSDIDRMNETALISLYAVPLAGSAYSGT